MTYANEDFGKLQPEAKFFSLSYCFNMPIKHGDPSSLLLEALNLTASHEMVVSVGSRYSDIGEKNNKCKSECEAEVEQLKNHMLTKTMCLHDFMLTNNVHCVSNESLLDALRDLIYVPECYSHFKY